MPDFNDVRLKRPEGVGICYQVTAGVAAIR